MNTPKRKPGNPGGQRGPYKPDEEKKKKITLTLDPDVVAFLKTRPKGPSRFVNEWVKGRI